MGGGIANINLGPVYGTFNGGILTISFSQISGNTASGQGSGIFEATITSSGPAAGGPLTIKFSQVTLNRAAADGGIFAVPGSPVTLSYTVVAKTSRQLRPAGKRPGLQGLRTRFRPGINSGPSHSGPEAPHQSERPPYRAVLPFP
jgi:hypothetical protein